MLLTTMTDAEISTQIHKEYSILWDTTVERLLGEYDRERRKLKVDKASTYEKDYRVKTHGKNNWIICIGKQPSYPKYTGDESTCITCAVYYHAERGTRVLIPADGGRTSVFNPHFFHRYNERLNLQLQKPLDVIVHFLKNSKDIYDYLSPHQNKIKVNGYCKNGLLFGELSPDKKWLVWKTFVSRDLAKPEQEQMEAILKGQLAKQLLDDLERPWLKPEQVKSEIHKIYELIGQVA
jgi:hypothetical protein